ncbi:hypothetical protein ACHMXB_21340 (plasmid) [Arthrobacter sp. UC242_113]|uniref:hypothetical protein n=1 Tax=Arthrobacter sp. UC242_113 TaxID=3374550 RepID=UPI0037578187
MNQNMQEPPPEDDTMPDDAWIPPQQSSTQDAATPTTPAPARAAGADTGTGGPTAAGPGVEAIPEILDRLGGVEELAAGLFEELSAYPDSGPWFWADLKPAQRKELWVELDGFVVWLQNRILRHSSNSLGWIPECWYRHPDAVELLTALMVAHTSAYRGKSRKPGFELTEWFSRGLWPTMEALERRMTFKNCMEGQGHFDATSPGLELTAANPDFTAFVEQETAASGTAETGTEDRAGAGDTVRVPADA